MESGSCTLSQALTLPIRQTQDCHWQKVTLFALIAFSVNKSNLKRKKKQLEQAEANAPDQVE